MTQRTPTFFKTKCGGGNVQQNDSYIASLFLEKENMYKSTEQALASKPTLAGDWKTVHLNAGTFACKTLEKTI